MKRELNKEQFSLNNIFLMKNIERNIALLLFLICWIYVWIRAVTVPLSHDEVATFFHFVHAENLIDLPANDLSANNHLLNTFLTFISYKLFGYTELVLRLPNLLIAPLYFFYHYLISKKLQSSLLKWVYIVCLFCTHYLMEHLGYTRGYGMSLAFLSGAIYFALEYSSARSIKNLWKLCLMLLLALAANLALMHSFIIILGFVLFVGASGVRQMKKRELYGQLLVYAITIVGFLIAVDYLLELKEKGALYMGSQEGFWEVSIVTLIQSINFDYNDAIATFIMLIFGMSVLAFFVSNSKNISLKTLSNNNNFYSYLFIGNIAAIILSNKIMEVNYPENRAVMFLIPYLIGSFCFAVNGISSTNKLKRVFVFSALLLLFIPIRSFGFINLSYQTYIDFIKQRIPPRYITYIQEDAKNNNYKPLVSGYHMRHFVYNYYNFKNGGELNHFYEHDYPGRIADFQIVDTSESINFTKEYEVVDHDEITNYSLIKRKERTVKKKLFETTFNGSNGSTNQEYFDFFKNENVGNSLKEKAVLLKFDFKLKSSAIPFNARLVIDLSDENGKNLFYDYFPLGWTKTEWDGTFNYHMYIHTIPKETKKIVVYLWNINGKEFEVSKGTIKFEEIIIK